MRNAKISVILIFFLILGSSLNSLTMLGNAQDEEEEFVQFDVEYSRKIYHEESDTWNFTITNQNCISDSAEKASFYLKIYLDEELLWNEYTDAVYSTWQLGLGEKTTRSFRFPPWSEAKLHKVRIELYWAERSKPVAKRTKVVHVAKVFVLDWNPPTQIVSREADGPSNLSISFKNGGNDDMFNTSLAVVDVDGLEITPQLQDLGRIAAGETKTVVFDVNTSRSKEQKQVYNPWFEIVYYDFRGILHTEEFKAMVRVITNPLIHNLTRMLGATALTIALGAVTLFVALVKKTKRHSSTASPSMTTKSLAYFPVSRLF